MLSIFDDGPPPPCPTPFNLAEDVLAAGAATPDKIVLEVVGPNGGQNWSHARLTAAVRSTGAGLLALGMRPGDRVLMRLGNTVEFPVLFLGAIAAGLVPVPTSPQLTAPEVQAVIRVIRPALLAAGPGIALPDAPGCRVLDLPGLRSLQDRAPGDWDRGDPDRIAYIVFTSGSSGQPRAVLHAHRAIRARRMMWAGWYGLTAADRVLHAGAFNWTFTLGTGLMDPWAAGATALIPGEGVDPTQLPPLLHQHGATLFAAAPGVYRHILRDRTELDLPRLRHGLSAGEALPEATRTAWRAATGTELHEALGMSECSTFVSGSPDRPAPHGATGFPQPGRRLAVLGRDGTPVRRGSPGTLAVSLRDPGLFLGYLDAEAETLSRIRGEWFLSGDTVVMDAQGAITFLGRDDDMMNAGGYRVSPLEVEAAMAAHPSIRDCAAVEVRVKPGVTAIALAYTGEPATEAALLAFAAARLARYKRPRLWRHVMALPRGANGKLLRRALRRDLEATLDPA